MGCLRCCCVVLCCVVCHLYCLSSIFMYMLHSMYTYTYMQCCHCVFNIRILGMPVVKDPFFKRYISNSGLDHVEPLFRQLKNDRPDLQLVMIILPGKTPVYGISRARKSLYTLSLSLSSSSSPIPLTPPLPFPRSYTPSLPPSLPPYLSLPTFLSLSPSLTLPLLPSCMSPPPPPL